MHAGDGAFFDAVKLDAVDDAGNIGAAKFGTDVERGAGFGVDSIERADGEKFVHKIGAQVHAGGRLDGSQANSAGLREVHGHRAEIAESAVHVGQFAF